MHIGHDESVFSRYLINCSIYSVYFTHSLDKMKIFSSSIFFLVAYAVFSRLKYPKIILSKKGKIARIILYATLIYVMEEI